MSGRTIEIVVAAAAVFVALVAAGIAVWNTRVTSNVAGAQLILAIDKDLAAFAQVAGNLRPGGKWTMDGAGPEDADEWGEVERYMGVFERVNRMLDQNLIAVEEVADFYGYRVDNIAANEPICQTRLEGEQRQYWCEFIALQTKLDRYRKNNPRRQC